MAVGPQTITGYFDVTVAAHGDQPALGAVRDGVLHWHTWHEVWIDSQRLATALWDTGIQPGDRVAHVSENRYEWVVTDLALHLAQAVHVPIHVTLSGEQIASQIVDSGARLVFVSSEPLFDKFRAMLPKSVTVWLHDDEKSSADFGELSRAGASPSRAPSLQSPSSDDLATILFTSGTTGRPRGVMLSQRNLVSNAAAMMNIYGGDSEQTRLNILPLSHIYARTCDLYTWVCRGSRLVLGEGRETIYRDCQLVRPTVFNAVPYVYQKIAERVRANGAEDESAALSDYFGGRIRHLSCGGATISPELETWYSERGLTILPGYGMTESSPVIAASTVDAHRLGCVGPPLPNVDVRIAGDGEVLARGPSVMMGYWKDEAATAEIIRDGWLHTGDLGEIDADGFLTIRGRKKELIVLSTGKKVSPTHVESLLAASPLIEQAAVFGEGRSGLAALIVPAKSREQGAGRREIRAEIVRCLASAAHEEQVRDFVVLDRPFSIERGEMTAKLSLCRAVIARNFAAELAAMEVGPQASKSAAPSQNS